MTGKELYGVYLGLNLHFTKAAYDYTTYGLRKVDDATLGKHYVFCNGIGRLFQTREELEDRLIATMKNRKLWLKDINSPEAIKTHHRHVEVLRNLPELFESDMRFLRSEYPALDNAFRVHHEGQTPMFMKHYARGDILYETMIILDNLMGSSKKVDMQFSGIDHLRMEKYKAFFQPDMRLYAKLAKPYFL